MRTSFIKERATKDMERLQRLWRSSKRVTFYCFQCFRNCWLYRSMSHSADDWSTAKHTVFSNGSHHEIFEYVRVRIPVDDIDLLWRSRGLWLLYAVVGALVHLRETHSVNIDYRLIRETMELEHLRELCKMDIPENLRYDIESYLNRLPSKNAEIVHGFILEQLNRM